jgi:hypothetical protein
MGWIARSVRPRKGLGLNKSQVDYHEGLAIAMVGEAVKAAGKAIEVVRITITEGRPAGSRRVGRVAIGGLRVVGQFEIWPS